MWVCLKTEELRWGSPTATPPFEPFVQPVPELVEGARAPLSAMSGGFGNRLLTVFLVLQA
jgi:hypothetical protein